MSRAMMRKQPTGTASRLRGPEGPMDVLSGQDMVAEAPPPHRLRLQLRRRRKQNRA